MHEAFRKVELQNHMHWNNLIVTSISQKTAHLLKVGYPPAAKTRGSQCLSINTITNDGCRWRSNPVSNLIELRLILHPTRGCPRRAIHPFADAPVRRGLRNAKIDHVNTCSCSVAVAEIIDSFQLSLCTVVTSGRISSV